MKERKTLSSINEIIAKFNNWLKSQTGNRSDWYVGIAADPEDRLTNGHGLDGRDACMWLPANSSSDARAVEKHFLDAGFDGGGGGGDNRTTQVYTCFKSSRFRH